MNAPQKPEMKKVINESGIEVKPLYTAADVEASGGMEMVGEPGAYPFTRGIHREMYRKQPWTMRQYAGFGNPADTNQRFKYLIANGQTGLNVAFDLPTQIGLDSDDPLAEGEIGRVGMSIDTLRDFEIAFDGIDLKKITVSLTINGAAAILIAMYLAMAEKRGYDIKELRGTAQNDILKEFIGRGTWIFPVEPSIRLVGDTIEYCAKEAPKYTPVSVCGYHIRESGATPAQEIAYAFCIAKAYADDAIRRGLPVDEFAGRLSYNFNIFGNIFEQVCKFRAGRGLWAKIMKEQYGAEKPGSMWLRMIAAGGGGGLTFEQPEVNIMRGAYYALISALSGTQTMALVFLRRGLHHPHRVLGAHLAAHHAVADRGNGPDRNRRSAGGLLLRRDHDQRDAQEDGGNHGRGRCPGRHRQDGGRRHHPGQGLGPGLRHAAQDRVRRVPQGRRQLLQATSRKKSTRSSSIPTTRTMRGCRSKASSASAPSATMPPSRPH
jgi:methylmalonyl-CoA mutase cobalamin-binding domain/chain